MGEVELIEKHRLLVIHSDLFFYGKAASGKLATEIARSVELQWNEPEGKIWFRGNWHLVQFRTRGFFEPLNPEEVWYNTNARLNFFRIEEYSPADISFVDGLGCNTGYFKLANLLQTSTTAAHEYGHSLGLEHPVQLDIRGKGAPGIMFPRGTLCDPVYQYDPGKPAGVKGGTLDPRYRKVLQSDIDALALHRLKFNAHNIAVLGAFSSVYHSDYSLNEEINIFS
jgi:hypothetical protein